MATLREIKKAFFALSQKEQEEVLKELYGFSKDIKIFLNIRLLGDGEKAYIEQIKKASQSATPKGMPKMIDVRKVNAILSKAKKSGVSKDTITKMEWLAFDGYMTFLNDYGGGPEIYEDKVYDHLNNYLLQLMELDDKKRRDDEIKRVSKYLRSHTNMCYDHIWDLFFDITKMEV